MTIEDINGMLKIMSKAPDSSIDEKITKDLSNLIGKPIPEIKLGVMKAIDESVRYGLVSGFGLQALNILHEVYLDGKPSDFIDDICVWRK